MRINHTGFYPTNVNFQVHCKRFQVERLQICDSAKSIGFLSPRYGSFFRHYVLALKHPFLEQLKP